MTLVDLNVLEGVEMRGSINTEDDQLIANVTSAIRRGYPQLRPQAPQKERVCLVGGGPSLEPTLSELRDLHFAGAKIVTVNGAYQWCIEHNLRPSAQIVLDARPENARFVQPAVPQCRYFIASQCAPETWAAVADRPDVWIWHAVGPDNPTVKPILDRYYQGQWLPTPGGTTVIMRAIIVLRMLGFLRFDLFGVDSCFMGAAHHAYAQPENAADKPHPFKVYPTAHPDRGRIFQCAGWHVKQLECFLQLIRLQGSDFALHVHGDGLLAFALQASADVQMEQVTAD